jgi:hypothetical protein
VLLVDDDNKVTDVAVPPRSSEADTIQIKQREN